MASPISTVETLTRSLRYEGTTVSAARRIRLDFSMTPQKASRFPRTARLLRHADFERVYKQGRRHFSATMTVFYLARPDADAVTRNERARGARNASPSGLRVGFTVGRSLGGAVQRNRMKRRLREAVRMALPTSAIAADVVINPKKALLSVDFSAVSAEVSRAFEVIKRKMAATPMEKLAVESVPGVVGGSGEQQSGSRKPEGGRRS